jgi:hypothetical protein
MKTSLKKQTTAIEGASPARTLSTDRAFVVHFHLPDVENQPPCAGRIEHVPTGRTRHFESWPELIEFVAQIIGPAPETHSSRKE